MSDIEHKVTKRAYGQGGEDYWYCQTTLLGQPKLMKIRERGSYYILGEVIEYSPLLKKHANQIYDTLKTQKFRDFNKAQLEYLNKILSANQKSRPQSHLFEIFGNEINFDDISRNDKRYALVHPSVVIWLLYHFSPNCQVYIINRLIDATYTNEPDFLEFLTVLCTAEPYSHQHEEQVLVDFLESQCDALREVPVAGGKIDLIISRSNQQCLVEVTQSNCIIYIYYLHRYFA